MSITGLPGRGRSGGHGDRRSVVRALLRHRHPDCPARARSLRRRQHTFCWSRRSLRWISRLHAGQSAARCRPRLATITRLRSRQGSIPAPTVVSTSPPAARTCLNGCWRSAPMRSRPIRITPRESCTRPRRAERRNLGIHEDENSAEWIDLFNEGGVPCGPIHTIDKMSMTHRSSIWALPRRSRRPHTAKHVVGQAVNEPCPARYPLCDARTGRTYR